jgi:hypothetical protein
MNCRLETVDRSFAPPCENKRHGRLWFLSNGCSASKSVASAPERKLRRGHGKIFGAHVSFDTPCLQAGENYLAAMATAHAKIEILPRGSFRDGGSNHSRRASLQRMDMLARLFDTAFMLPGTNVRFGIESIMRLVPSIGDAAASALSCYLLYEAHQLKVPSHIFARLVANVAIEGVVGAVPLIGDLFDVGFRANRRNVKILQDYFTSEGLI